MWECVLLSMWTPARLLLRDAHNYINLIFNMKDWSKNSHITRRNLFLKNRTMQLLTSPLASFVTNKRYLLLTPLSMIKEFTRVRLIMIQNDGGIIPSSTTYTGGLGSVVGSHGGHHVRRSLPDMGAAPTEPPKLYPYHLLIITNYRLPADVDRCNLEVNIII